MGGVLYRIGGVEDHVHMLVDVPPSISLADFVKRIKGATSHWVKEQRFGYWDGWGSGYCALTYSLQEKETIINYIKNQEEHHKKYSFQEELERVFLMSNIKDMD